MSAHKPPSTVSNASAVLCFPNGHIGSWFSGRVELNGHSNLRLVAAQRLDQDACMVPGDGSSLLFDVGFVSNASGSTAKAWEATLESVSLSGGSICKLWLTEATHDDDTGAAQPQLSFNTAASLSCLDALATVAEIFPELLPAYEQHDGPALEAATSSLLIVSGTMTVEGLVWVLQEDEGEQQGSEVGRMVGKPRVTVKSILSRPAPEHSHKLEQWAEADQERNQHSGAACCDHSSQAVPSASRGPGSGAWKAHEGTDCDADTSTVLKDRVSEAATNDSEEWISVRHE